MSKQNATGYKKSDNAKSCQSCRYGQYNEVCARHNFVYDSGFVCDGWQELGPIALASIKTVELPKPHGYLIWKGKQTAIAHNKPLPDSEPVVILSEGEAFGVATLGKPAQVNLAEFERQELTEQHRIRPEERRFLWPDDTALYIHPIKTYNGFSKPKPVINDHIAEYEPTETELKLIRQGKLLPKEIILDTEAVCLTDDHKFVALQIAQDNGELSRILESVYEIPVEFVNGKKDFSLSLYSLALVRQPFPKMRVEKVLKTILSAEKQHTGVMVAFMLDPEAAGNLNMSLRDLPEGAEVVPPDELHLTLIYLGDSNKLQDRDLIERVLSVFADGQHPLMGKVGGVGLFSNVESDGTQALYASFDSPKLPEFREEIVDRLAHAGIEPPSLRGFTPHITLAYLPQGADLPKLELPDQELIFENITLAWGDDHIHFPLGKKKEEKSSSRVGQSEVDQSGVNRSGSQTADYQTLGLKGDNMPWKIETMDSKTCVVKEDDMSVVQCYEGGDAQDRAQALLAALVINTGEGMDDDEKMSLQEHLEMIRGKFRDRFGDDYEDPWVVDVFEDHIIAEWEGVRYMVPFEETESDIVFASRPDWLEVQVTYLPKQAAVESSSEPETPVEALPETDKEGRRLRTMMLDKLRSALSALTDFVGWAEYADLQAVEEQPVAMADFFKSKAGFTIKLVNGEPWHFTWSTNAYQDRDKEAFSLKGLERYVQENAKKKHKGYFNFWHIKGTDFAEKEFQAVVGKFLVEAGPYLKDEKGRAALKFFSEFPDGHPDIAPEGWGCSPEYRYLPEERDTGVYSWLWIVRTSTLPKAAAANIWTESKQEIPIMDEQQRKAAAALFGEDFVNNLVSEGERRTGELDQAGVPSKAKKSEGESEENSETPPAEEAPAEIKPEPKEAPESDDKPETPEEQPVNFNMKEFVALVAGKMMEDLKPAIEGPINQLSEEVKAISDRVGNLEKAEVFKKETDMSRFFNFQVTRASQAEETEVSDKDGLKDKRPAEEKPRQGEIAGAFFPAKK